MQVNDAELVTASRAGNLEAFGQIVARYQTLICSLAYSNTGNMSQSEDLAQETFIAAWKQLASLREPAKLRQWLCGIARYLTFDALKKEGREPSSAAEPLDAVHEAAAPEPLPHDLTISREEQAILWRSLERVPAVYREPLVLFYREHQSIETVAAHLDLSEDAVKQRLSRGRKLLQEQIMGFIEGALERSNPGKAFTVAVLAAMPASMTISAKAATLGVTAAKGSVAAKSAGIMGLCGALLTPLVIIFGGYASYRLSVDGAYTDEERGHIKRGYLGSLMIALGLTILSAGPLFWVLRKQHEGIYLFWVLLFIEIIVFFFLAAQVAIIKSLPGRRRYLAGLLTDQYAGHIPPAGFEYRSRWSLLGLPLIHVRAGNSFDLLRGPVKAWIAIGGSQAMGVIFAWGGIAVAPISFGGIAIGLLPFGAIALGVFPIGAITVGIWAYGAAAIGWQIYSGCGIAWKAAAGGMVAARDFALGGIACAAQANTKIAEQFFQQSFFFQIGQAISRYNLLLMLTWAVPVFVKVWLVARARRRQEQQTADF